jgi:hypothetical protein
MKRGPAAANCRCLTAQFHNPLGFEMLSGDTLPEFMMNHSTALHS